MIKTRKPHRPAGRHEASRRPVSRVAASSRRKKPTLVSLASELDRLRERLEDLEDLRDLEEAVQRNAGAPLIPWVKVKQDLGLD